MLQGSVVGPLLFTVYVNDVCSRLQNSTSYLYADDIALVVSGKDVNHIKVLLQEDLDSVGTWCRENKLIRSTIEYCSFTYGGGPVWAECKLQTLQNDALRICEKI